MNSPNAVVGEVAKHDVDDWDSIQTLNRETARCFTDDNIRMQYIAAQVASIDLKVDSAVEQVMKLYKHTVRAAPAMTTLPGASTTNQFTLGLLIYKTMIGCFGASSVSESTVQHILKRFVWNELGHSVSVAFAEIFATAGLLGTLALGGIPILIPVAAISTTLVVPTTARLCLMFGCDVMLVLMRAFKQSTDRCLEQPLPTDFEAAADAYRDFSKAVHERVKGLIPREPTLFFKSFQTNSIREGFVTIVADYRGAFVNRLPGTSGLKAAKIRSSSDNDNNNGNNNGGGVSTTSLPLRKSSPNRDQGGKSRSSFSLLRRSRGSARDSSGTGRSSKNKPVED